MKIMRFGRFVKESVSTEVDIKKELAKGTPIKFRSDEDGEYIYGVFQKYGGSGNEAIVLVGDSIDVVMLSELELA